LGYSGNKKLVFKAPTGSGKTIMMAGFFKRLVDDREIKQPFSFIWTAPRPVLTNQSKDKLEIILRIIELKNVHFLKI
jgi:superfamily II DNA or RNA helicase